jgi:hypothetical protein
VWCFHNSGGGIWAFGEVPVYACRRPATSFIRSAASDLLAAVRVQGHAILHLLCSTDEPYLGGTNCPIFIT